MRGMRPGVAAAGLFRRHLGGCPRVEEPADGRVEGRLRPVHAAEVPRLVEMDAGVAHLLHRIAFGFHSADAMTAMAFLAAGRLCRELPHR